MAKFEMKALDKFQIKGVGLVVIGDVVSGSIQVADKVIISNGETSLESIVTGIIIGKAQVDSYSYNEEQTEIGLVFPKLKRTDMKGMIEQYTIVAE